MSLVVVQFVADILMQLVLTLGGKKKYSKEKLGNVARTVEITE